MIGNIKFTQSFGAMNHVAVDGEENTFDVKVNTLDKILKERVPNLIKIDVEGFETEVIKGSNLVLQKDDLKAIIIELNNSGNRYSFDENEVHKTLLGYGFIPYDYRPKERKLIKLDTFGNHNTIYIRDIEYVKKRVSTARRVKIGNNSIGL